MKLKYKRIKDTTPFGQIAEGVFALEADILLIETTELAPLLDDIAAKEQQIEDQKTAKKIIEDDFAVNADISFVATQAFPPGSGDYNYASCFNVDDIVLSSPAAQDAGYTSFSEVPDGYLKDQLKNNWEEYSSNFLTQAIRNSRLDSFYNYKKLTITSVF